MSFDLKAELDRVNTALDKVRADITGKGPSALLGQLDFVQRCDTVSAQLAKLLREIPPPEPTPPLTSMQIEIADESLRTLTWVERQSRRVRRRKKGPLPDIHHQVPVRGERTVTVTLPEPRFPGSPEKEYPIAVQHRVVRKVQADEIDTTVFEYQVEGETRTVHIVAPEIPPDDPPTPAQQAYLDRVAEIAREVRDIRTLIADLDRQVGDLRRDADGLVAAAEGLCARVVNFPTPSDITPELTEASRRIEAVVNQLPGIEQELNALAPVLPDILKRAQDACPEIP